MAKTEKKHALYLRSPEGDRIELVHGDEVEDRKGEGWEEPEGRKANGEEWNAEDDLPGQDITADLAKQDAEHKAKKAAEEAKAQAEADKAAEKARAEAEKAKK